MEILTNAFIENQKMMVVFLKMQRLLCLLTLKKKYECDEAIFDKSKKGFWFERYQ